MSSPSRSRKPFHRAARRSALLLTTVLLANASTTFAQAPGTLLLNEGFDVPLWPNWLITNEYATSNPTDPDRPVSPTWEMTSGSLFSRASRGATGWPDAGCTPDRYSQTCRNSAIWRLNTKRDDFGNVKVLILKLRVNAFSSTTTTPPQGYDGVHIWLRYRSEEQLYVASVARRDGHIVIKKKCPGGTTNGGTYHVIGQERSGFPVPTGQDMKVAASASTLADGSVRLRLFRDAAWVLDVTDTGTGCPPIAAPGAVGLRMDNVDGEVDDYSVEAVP